MQLKSRDILSSLELSGRRLKIGKTEADSRMLHPPKPKLN